jgi:hypothetical protein
VADLNGDGKSDLIWKETAGAGAIAVWLMNGLQYVASANVAASGAVTHVGDLNGDGKDDLILRINDVTYAYLMNGQTIASATQLATGANRAVIEVGDFNGDGRTDLVWHDFATGSTSIALMNGAATLSSAVVLTSADWFVTGAGEFNADGKADLLWRNRATGEVAIWLMDGTRFNGGATLLADPNWRVAKVGNFNGDVGAGGRPKHDLLWRNLATGDHAVWLMNGSAFAGGAIVLNGANWWALP